jgi:hypothetical protein
MLATVAMSSRYGMAFGLLYNGIVGTDARAYVTVHVSQALLTIL